MKYDDLLTADEQAQLRMAASIEAARQRYPDFDEKIRNNHFTDDQIQEALKGTVDLGEYTYQLAKAAEFKPADPREFLNNNDPGAAAAARLAAADTSTPYSNCVGAEQERQRQSGEKLEDLLDPSKIDADRDAWIEQRQQEIGARDAAEVAEAERQQKENPLGSIFDDVSERQRDYMAQLSGGSK